ncbi:MAG: hypothetical protein ACM3ME_03045 [Chloroflexota bacterium]
MKKIILFISIIILPTLMSAQQETGQINVSDWVLFSIGYNKQLKKIDDSTMYAYYRSGTDKSGILIFDKSMKVTRNIPLELTKTKKVIFSQKAFAQFVSFPFTFYRPDIRAVVIVGYNKNDKKDYSIVAITYSIDGAGLLDVQELSNASSDHFLIKYSSNEEYFVVAELLKKQGKGEKVEYEVFNKECQKMYSTKCDLLADRDNYFRILDNGELFHYTIKEEGRKITYLFTKFDSLGNSEVAAFAPPKTDIYTYERFDIVRSAAGEYFATCMKYRSHPEGMAILKLDFEKKTVKKITDKDFDKAALAKLNTIKNKSIAMVGKKLKPIKDIDTYSIYKTSVDDDNIYVVLEDFYLRTKTDKSGTTYTYGSEGLIVASYDHNGNERWMVPVKRLAKQREGDMNLLNGNGTSIKLSSYETPEAICFLVRSQDKTYYTRIDKETGRDIEPILVLTDEKAYTNSNCQGWFDEDEVVVLSMKGTSIFKKNDYWLKGFKISK